jgi:glycosyltransferase involved in cell wall biosynthesis
MRLLVFIDQVYWMDGETCSTDEAYVRFPLAFAEAAQALVFLGRQAPDRGRRTFVLEGPGVEYYPLPFYTSLYQFWLAGPRFYSRLNTAVKRAVGNCDVAWICGPNPVALAVARECEAQKKPFFLVVRENLVNIMAVKHGGIKRWLAMTLAWWQQRQFKQMARGRTVFAVGEEMAAVYRAVTPWAHVHYPSLITREQQLESARSCGPPSDRRLLGVGRLSAEKGYQHLLIALARLGSKGMHCMLDLVGSGPEEVTLRKQSRELGLEKQVVFHGYVPFGPKLLSFYTRSSALVVPSLSEGFPQVICEALLLGLPAIASAVGGIPALLKHGETALLVPPGNAEALAEAIEHLLGSPKTWMEISRKGREQMREFGLEAQRDRMLGIIQSEILGNAAILDGRNVRGTVSVIP